MIIIERRIAKVVRYRRVYFPTQAQLSELVSNLRPWDLLRVFWAAATPSQGTRPVVQRQQKTIFVDLSKGSDGIYRGLHKNCRYKVRRAEKMRDRFRIAVNTEAARNDFVPFYNKFAHKKGDVPILTPYQFEEFLRYADTFMLYLDGHPSCGRMVLRDNEAHTALLMYSATSRFDEGADTITIGLLNRYLYWHEMKMYEAAGLEKYDFGGAGDVQSSLAHFKLSFGGQLSDVNYCFYAVGAPIFWKLMHSFYTFQRNPAATRIPAARDRTA
jgi:hypothetical protein